MFWCRYSLKKYLKRSTFFTIFQYIYIYILSKVRNSNNALVFRLQPKFGACLLLSTNIGFFIAFLAGNLLPYRIVPMIFVVFPIIFLLGMLLLPESPVFLMMNERMEVNYFLTLFLTAWVFFIYYVRYILGS